MKKKLIKFQVALYGYFDFPANPATTMKLVSSLGSLGFMPTILNGQDAMTGQISQSLGMVNGADSQILFGSGRIDFSRAMPIGDIDGFLDDVVKNIALLEEGSLKFNRVAIVVDTIFEELSHENMESLRRKFLPLGGERSIEWMCRWVTPYEEKDEKYNICFEAMSTPNLMMIFNGRTQPLKGVKIMQDVSTTQLDLNPRFDKGNLREILENLKLIISERADFF